MKTSTARKLASRSRTIAAVSAFGLLSIAVSTSQAPADDRAACAECVVEGHGPAAVSKAEVLKLLPEFAALRKACVGVQHESTMFLSPYKALNEQVYAMQLGFLLGDAAETIGNLSTLYTSYFIFGEKPSEPLLLLNVLSLYSDALADKLAQGFAQASADEISAFTAKRHVLLVRKTRTPGSAECMKAALPLIASHVKAVSSALPAADVSEANLQNVLYLQGSILDVLEPLSDEQTASLQKYRDSLYAVAAQKGVDRSGLKPLTSMPNIEVLSAGPTSLTVADLEAVSTLKKLRLLRLGGCGIDDAGLAPLGKLSKLEALSLRRNPFTSAGVAKLGGLKSLQQLSLAGSKIDDEALKTVGSLSNLRALFLQDTGVTDAGVKELEKLESLSYLALNGTRVTDASIESLLKLSNLRTLVLRGTAVTPEGRKKLASRAGQKLQIQ